jgi:hypothetical protein
MRRYRRFEIVRRAFGRFGWDFVVVDDGRRRVLARSQRSYGSKKRVRKAIAALKEARIVDATGTNGYEPIPLPATSFQFVPGVLPLIVEESPVEYDPSELRPRADRRRRRARERGDEAEGAREAAKAKGKPASKQAAAKRKPAGKRSRSRRTTA